MSTPLSPGMEPGVYIGTVDDKVDYAVVTAIKNLKYAADSQQRTTAAQDARLTALEQQLRGAVAELSSLTRLVQQLQQQVTDLENAP